MDFNNDTLSMDFNNDTSTMVYELLQMCCTNVGC